MTFYNEVLYCPVCGNALSRMELGDTTIYFCDAQKEHANPNKGDWQNYEPTR